MLEVSYETDELNEHLRYLLDISRLSGAAEGIAKQVIEKGLGSLKGDQQFVWDRHIEEAHLRRVDRFGHDVEICDLIAFEEFGLCGECRRSYVSFMGKDLE